MIEISLCSECRFSDKYVHFSFLFFIITCLMTNFASALGPSLHVTRKNSDELRSDTDIWNATGRCFIPCRETLILATCLSGDLLPWHIRKHHVVSPGQTINLPARQYSSRTLAMSHCGRNGTNGLQPCAYHD